MFINLDRPEVVMGENDFYFFTKVFFNNFIFFILCSGCVLNKYVTYVVIISNAYLLGINTPLIIMLQMGAVSVLLHGGIEFFGFFLGALIGLKSIEYHVANVKNTKLILLLGIIAIFLGALVEAYITTIFNDLNKENYYAGNFENNRC
ncbi:stage II sporulation protein M [Enterococcus casseliflavus]|uniref:stage II sporulation protein M n=1 Tax=Enterococcus casseliflavus TaxID=37734 RepID=UPI0035CB5849